MKKKFYCKIFRIYPYVDDPHRYQEVLIDSRFGQDSEFSDFSLIDVHTHFVRLVIRSPAFSSGRYRVTTSSSRSTSVESSYFLK